MANPVEGILPAVFDPFLEYLSTALPPPLYFFIINVLSHTFAAVTTIARLSTSLLSTTPSDWNAQALLPPIITILTAYLALASIYRTTTWALRLGFWFLKWGTLISVIMAGAGYFMGNAGVAVQNQGAAVLGDIFSSLFDGGDVSKRNRQTKSQRRSRNKPKAWDSFEQHREWQYQQPNEREGANVQTQQMMDMVVDVAGQVFETGDWWGTMKSFGRGSTQSDDEGKASAKHRERNSRSGNSRSR